MKCAHNMHITHDANKSTPQLVLWPFPKRGLKRGVTRGITKHNLYHLVWNIVWGLEKMIVVKLKVSDMSKPADFWCEVSSSIKKTWNTTFYPIVPTKGNCTNPQWWEVVAMNIGQHIIAYCKIFHIWEIRDVLYIGIAEKKFHFQFSERL